MKERTDCKCGRWNNKSNGEKGGHTIRARARLRDKQVEMKSGRQTGCEGRESCCYESDRKKVRKDTESDGTKGSCAACWMATRCARQTLVFEPPRASGFTVYVVDLYIHIYKIERKNPINQIHTFF